MDKTPNDNRTRYLRRHDRSRSASQHRFRMRLGHRYDEIGAWQLWRLTSIVFPNLCNCVRGRYMAPFEGQRLTFAPNNTSSRINCASKFGQAHSIGAAFGGGTVANFLGGNSASSLLNLFSNPPDVLSGGLGLPINDVLRLTGGQPQKLYGSLAGTIRSAGIKGAVNSFLGTGDGIVSLGGEASLASFGGIATTAATAAEAASWVGIAKFGYDVSTVAYGYFFACT
jgi:hypothetical protein